MSATHTIACLAERIKESEKHLSYTSPFVILSDHAGVIFESKEFLKLKRKGLALLDSIIGAMKRGENLPSTTYTVVGTRVYAVVSSEVAITSDGNGVHIAYMRDTDKIQTDEELLLAKHHHDIQGPLKNIANFLQLMRLQLKDGSYDELCEHIDHAVNNIVILGKLNDSILQRGTITMSRIDLKALIGDVETLCKDQIVSSGAKIVVDNDVPPIYGVYSDVLRVFKNLVENSLKHANTRSLIIRIKLLAATSRLISILFSDNGKRSSYHQKSLDEHLLESGDNMNSRLGLRICSEIMRKHHGSIRFLKEDGQYGYELVFAVSDEDSDAAS
ncbi:MAG: hypothetical protein LBF56_03645 [Holosporales bacterium]|jgi:light-regulated signal transduction histidine kinase (bacteriophytochrome)|nr:hypothetical protein [Holosporales bacterium]